MAFRDLFSLASFVWLRFSCFDSIVKTAYHDYNEFHVITVPVIRVSKHFYSAISLKCVGDRLASYNKTCIQDHLATLGHVSETEEKCFQFI